MVGPSCCLDYMDGDLDIHVTLHHFDTVVDECLRWFGDESVPVIDDVIDHLKQPVRIVDGITLRQSSEVHRLLRTEVLQYLSIVDLKAQLLAGLITVSPVDQQGCNLRRWSVAPHLSSSSILILTYWTTGSANASRIAMFSLLASS